MRSVALGLWVRHQEALRLRYVNQVDWQADDDPATMDAVQE